MRRRLTWFFVSLGIAALVRRLRRRGEAEREAPTPAAGAGDDPAAELRRKLVESRAEEAPEEPEPTEETVEDRRSDVHEQGRAALDDMRDAEKE
ncbi:hypothetical protein BH20ACT13_BH20ACT13_15080 [soil metagenome]